MPPEPFVPPPDEYEDPPSEEAALDAGQRDAQAKDQTDSATDPKVQARKRNRQKLATRRIEEFWKDALADPRGRAALWEFMNENGVTETRFALGPTGFPNSDATWFQAGQREAAEVLWQKLLRIDFANFHLMLTENHPAFRPQKG